MLSLVTLPVETTQHIDQDFVLPEEMVKTEPKIPTIEQLIAEEPVKTVEEPVEEEPEAERTTNIEWQAFVNATFRLETGNGTSWLWKNANNPGGIKCWGEPGESCTSGNYKIFPSQEAGLEALERLLQGYWTKYGMDFKSYRDRYCACGGNDLKNFTAIFNEELKKLGGKQ